MMLESDNHEDDSSVRVAVRIRPQNAREKIDLCQVCTSVTDDDHQIVIGKDKAFTFDHVFDTPTQQMTIYDACIQSLIEGCFEGYNATVFAYGQTGSGKTYTMGTGFDVGGTTLTDEIGIIPRAVDHLFKGIEDRRQRAFQSGLPAPEFKVTTQFMELYNEEVLDLMDTTRDPESRGRKSHIRIHEDACGGIYVVGATTRPVVSLEDTIECLKSGALSRATASTNMNVQSSRSHAIFTLLIRQHRLVQDENQPLEDGKEADTTQTEFETLTAKFHFVDLAGSERLKRTGATGDRQKEGISINCGLLALGNVISALGDKAKKGSHVPYRDSKLTRLLQDSLGGNSRTLMIACISPSDSDFMETLNTLKYANRAKNIKNKVMANQDKASKQLASLRAEISRLQQELIDYKTGRCTVDADGVETVSDTVIENSMLQAENDKLRQRVKALQDTIESLKARNTQLSADTALVSLGQANGETINEDVSNMVKKYLAEIEDLKSQLSESTSMCDHLTKNHAMKSPRSASSRMSLSSLSMLSSSYAGMDSVFGAGLDVPTSPDIMESSVLAEAKMEMKKLKKVKRTHSRNLNHESDKENVNSNNKDGDGQEQDTENDGDGLEPSDRNEENDKDNDDDLEVEDEDDTEDITTEHSSDSESDGGESDNVHEDLANLTCEINIKQRLIEELEQTQKKMSALKTHFEDKVKQLQQKIKETELERDKILSNIDKMSNSATESSKKVKQDFEKKLHGLQDELKKMQTERKKHVKLEKNNVQYERHLKTLQHELAEMKKTKVRLMKQMKEEVEKTKHSEARRNKEVSQLRKEQLRRDNIIKTLERETTKKDAVLKRKQEEVEALRKRQKPMSTKTAGRVGKYDKVPTIPVSPLTRGRRRRVEFSPKIAKQKWDSMEKNMTSVITKRQTVTMLERDMDVWLRQREKCSKQLEKYEQRKQEAVDSKQPQEVVNKLSATIGDLALKVEHAQENIHECQSNIMQMEGTKEDGDGGVEVSSLLTRLTLEESKYIIEKLYQQVIDKGQVMSMKESEVKELQGRLHQTELNNALQQDLLRHMMDDQVTIEVDDLMTHNSEMDDLDLTSSSSSSPAESMLESGPPSSLIPSLGANSMTASTDSLIRREKARRRTATTQDLLYPGGSNDCLPSTLMPVEESPREHSRNTKSPTGRPTGLPTAITSSASSGVSSTTTFPNMSHSLTSSTTLSSDSGATNNTIIVSPATELLPSFPTGGGDDGGADGDGGSSNSGGSDERLLMPPRTYKRSTLPRPSALRRKDMEQSPILGRRALIRSTSIGDASSDTTPPSSPTMARRGIMSRSSDENVFSRLTSSTSTSQAVPDPVSNRGSIVPSTQSRPTGTSRAPLMCTHQAEGHTKPVLCVCATDQLMFTGSKDRTVKSWDLVTGRELTSYRNHPNTVTKVAFCPKRQLLFSVCQSNIRVWDVRKTTDNCIKTLSSSGLTTNGSASYANRQTESTQHEHNINDIQLSPDGTTLFCGAGNVVQIWDLRRFSQAGKLCGHQAPVTALVVTKGQGNGNMVITGSKDHYIKIFDVIDDAAGILWPKHNLMPPHYDGVSSLALQGNSLFSGSRDMCIKKWDIQAQSHKHSINAAHKDWVSTLAFVPSSNVLISGGRGGYLKLWDPESCVGLGELKAHNSHINAIATNSSVIITAANDFVGIWRHRDLTDPNMSSDNLDLLLDNCVTPPLITSPS